VSCSPTGFFGVVAYHRGVTNFYSIEQANERLPEVEELLGRLIDDRRQLVALRDLAAERMATAGRTSDRRERLEDAAGDEELRAIRLRMQGVIDQMQAAVGQLDAWDVMLRDIPSGLVDFPALVNGRQVWLCWRLGEDDVGWWHELDAGVAGRRPLSDLT
jgi:hypothetical protein